jgi:hypothetical protein
MCPKMVLAEKIPINNTFPKCSFPSSSLIFTCRLQHDALLLVFFPLPHPSQNMPFALSNTILSKVPH